MAGGKVFVPFNSNIRVSAKQLTLSGYYPDFNVDVSSLPQHGFGTIMPLATISDDKLETVIRSPIIETGAWSSQWSRRSLCSCCMVSCLF
jgi:hypothetical protein